MTDETTANGRGPEQAPAPRLSIATQYIRDLSFENPKAPAGLAPNIRPEIQIRVDTQAQQIEGGQNQFEVVLDLKVEAKAQAETVFLLELSYAGLFIVENIPQDSLQPLLLIECPRLLFPFARRVVADLTRDGGFPPLMIDPIDFVALFRQRVAAAQAATTTA